MTPRIKICGLMKIEDILTVNEAKPDYAGFMFYERSKRYITPDTAKVFYERLDRSIKAVGVFVDKEISDIAKIAEEGIIDIVQLHGHESEKYIRELRMHVSLPVIKAFSVTGPVVVEEANRSPADMVLLDSGAGGTGTRFNWDLISKVRRDYFLAGGLDPDNAGEAAKLGSYALDVSSGVETDGHKDADKIRRFIEEVRGRSI